MDRLGATSLAAERGTLRYGDDLWLGGESHQASAEGSPLVG